MKRFGVLSVKEPPTDTNKQVWRGALGTQILHGGKAMAWTADDQRLFLVFAVRYRWTADMLDHNKPGVKDLQMELYALVDA